MVRDHASFFSARPLMRTSIQSRFHRALFLWDLGHPRLRTTLFRYWNNFFVRRSLHRLPPPCLLLALALARSRRLPRGTDPSKTDFYSDEDLVGCTLVGDPRTWFVAFDSDRPRNTLENGKGGEKDGDGGGDRDGHGNAIRPMLRLRKKVEEWKWDRLRIGGLEHGEDEGRKQTEGRNCGGGEGHQDGQPHEMRYEENRSILPFEREKKPLEGPQPHPKQQEGRCRTRKLASLDLMRRSSDNCSLLRTLHPSHTGLVFSKSRLGSQPVEEGSLYAWRLEGSLFSARALLVQNPSSKQHVFHVPAFRSRLHSISTSGANVETEWNDTKNPFESLNCSTPSDLKCALNMDSLVDSFVSNPPSSSPASFPSSLSATSTSTTSPQVPATTATSTTTSSTPLLSSVPSSSSNSSNLISSDAELQRDDSKLFGPKFGRSKIGTEILQLLSNANDGDLDKILSPHKEGMDSSFIKTLIRSQSDVKMILRLFEWLKQQQFFQKDVTLCVSLVGKLYHHKAFHEMEMVIGDLINGSDELNDGFEFDVHTYEQLIKHCSYADNSQLASNIYAKMVRSGMTPSVNVFSMLIDMCTETRNYSLGSYYYDEMRRMRIIPDTVLCNSLISFFGKLGYPSKVHSIFDFMKANQLTPNIQTFSKIVDIYAKAGDIENAEFYLHEMKKFNLQPNVVVYTSLINACTKANDGASADRVVKRMKEEGLVLDSMVYATLLDFYVQNGDQTNAELLYRRCRSKGVRMNRVFHNIMLVLYLKQKDYSNAREVIEEMKNSEVFPGIDTYSYLLWSVVECEEEEDMKSLYDLLEASSFPLHRILSLLLVDLVEELSSKGNETAMEEEDETHEERAGASDGKKEVRNWNRENGAEEDWAQPVEEEDESLVDTEPNADWTARTEMGANEKEHTQDLELVGQEQDTKDAIQTPDVPTTLDSQCPIEPKRVRTKAIWNQVSDLLSTIRFEKYEKRKKYIDALVSFLCKMEYEGMAAKIWVLSRSHHIISHLLYQDSHSWILDLRSLDMSTALVALKCELVFLRRSLSRGRRCAREMEIVTGMGFRGVSHKGVRLRDAVRQALTRLRSPFQVHPSNAGRQFAFGDDVARWLSKIHVARSLKFSDSIT